jgi:hypothetical protein
MSTSDVSSLEKALAEEGGTIGAGFRYLPDPEQLDLLRDKNGRLPQDALPQLRRQSGPGRRKGSLNKASRQVAKYFIERYGDPLDVLGEIINTPTDALVEQLKLAQGGEAKHKPVRAMDAINLRMRAADIALPYIHGKQPIQVEIGRKGAVILNIEGLTDPAHLAEYTDAPELTEEGLAQLTFAPKRGSVPVEDAEFEVIDNE